MGMPDWTPSNSAAHDETVAVYSNCDEVELFLNDKSLGTKPKDPADTARQWGVPYAPGVIRAVGSNKGVAAAREEMKSAGPATKVFLRPERETLINDWENVAYIRATLDDANGVFNPTATGKIRFSISGPGVLVATDNGDVACHEPFQSAERSTWQGTCVAIIRATANSGTITVTASCDGLADGKCTIEAAPLKR